MTPPASDLAELSRDVADTRREAKSISHHIAVACMVSSVITSGEAFYYLMDHTWLAVPWGVLLALIVDYALVRWLPVSARLRKLDADSREGRLLSRTTFAMTGYLNVSGGLAPLVPPLSPLAWVMIAVAHSFIPIVAWISQTALETAQLFLQRKERDAQAAAERTQREEADRQRAEAERVERERATNKRIADQRVTAEANAKAKESEVDAEKARQEGETRRAEIARDQHLITNLVALCSLWSMRLENQQAIMKQAERRVRDRQRRQGVDRPLSTGRQQRTNSAPTAPVNSARQQPSPKPGAGKTPTVDELLTVARAHLSTAQTMGRPTLQAWLSEQLGGAPVSQHKAQKVLDAIRPNNDAAKVIDFAERAAGGHR